MQEQEAAYTEPDAIYPGSTFARYISDEPQKQPLSLGEYYSALAGTISYEARHAASPAGALLLASLIDEAGKEPPLPMIIGGQRVSTDDDAVRNACGTVLREASKVLLNASELGGQDRFLMAVQGLEEPQAFAVKQELFRILQARYDEERGDCLTAIDGMRLRFTQRYLNRPERFDVSMTVDSDAIMALHDMTPADPGEPPVPSAAAPAAYRRPYGPDHTAPMDVFEGPKTSTSLSATRGDAEGETRDSREVIPATQSAKLLAELEGLIPNENETWVEGVRDMRRLLRARIAEANDTPIPALEGDDAFAVAERLRLFMKEAVAFAAPPTGTPWQQEAVIYNEPLTYTVNGATGRTEISDHVAVSAIQELQHLLGADLRAQEQPKVYYDGHNRFTSKVTGTQIGNIGFCITRFQRIDKSTGQPLPEQMQVTLTRPPQRKPPTNPS